MLSHIAGRVLLNGRKIGSNGKETWEEMFDVFSFGWFVLLCFSLFFWFDVFHVVSLFLCLFVCFFFHVFPLFVCCVVLRCLCLFLTHGNSCAWSFSLFFDLFANIGLKCIGQIQEHLIYLYQVGSPCRGDFS